MPSYQGYRTKQKEEILNYLISHKSCHVTADEITTHFAATGVKVGKSTVYRYLDRLVSQGVVRKYIIEEGVSACYQFIEDNACHQHFHLKCVGCGQLIHMECDYLDQVNQHILKEHGFHIDSCKTVLYGTCASCAAGKDHSNA